jgi:RNA polymerase sigma-70 factor (ECF subfamily)
MSSPEPLVVPLGRVRASIEAYDSEFARLRPYLVGICRSLVGDDAEDVVQDTYLTGRSRLEQLRDKGLLRSWLTTIAINRCFDRHRRRQRLQSLLGSIRPRPAPASDLDLRAQIEALPNRSRTVLVLHYGHGLSHDEIASLLGLEPVTVRSIAFRARRRLRLELGEDHNKDGGSR